MSKINGLVAIKHPTGAEMFFSKTMALTSHHTQYPSHRLTCIMTHTFRPPSIPKMGKCKSPYISF